MYFVSCLPGITSQTGILDRVWKIFESRAFRRGLEDQLGELPHQAKGSVISEWMLIRSQRIFAFSMELLLRIPNPK